MNILGTFSATVVLLSAAVADPAWREISPGVWRQASQPAAYVLIDGRRAIAVGAPDHLDLDGLEKSQSCRVETILLTHHHRDATAVAARLIRERRIVRAPQASEPWLSVEGVRRHWRDSIPEIPVEVAPPLTHRRWAKWQYFVHGEGIADIIFDVVDGTVIRCGKWQVTAIAAPGHSPDHTAYLAMHDDRSDRVVFCGDAFFREGKLWTPYTTDWHHQNADGLTAAAETLRRLAALEPTLLCPEHGEPQAERINAQLSTTALNVRRAAIAKSYEAFLREEGRPLPLPEFLAPEQVGSATPDGNTKPWTKLSPHLFLSGNTYAIVSRDGPALLMDPYHRALPQRLEELRRDHGVGPVEAMFVSHAHNDHYTGVFAFDPAQRPEVWTLDRIADVIESPDRYRAPYVDPRPVPVARKLRDGETITWREYRLRIHHQPGQTVFAMGVETEIDGHRVLFTGDNFYRADQYSGSGGWSGQNRGLPDGYVQSIERILAMKPEWILAEHGGAMAFDANDFDARLRWAREATAAADALSPSGDHRRDWNPHRARIEPVIVRVRPGDVCPMALAADDSLAGSNQLWLRTSADGPIAPIDDVNPLTMEHGRASFSITIRADAKPGRYVLPTEIGTDVATNLPIDCVLVIVVMP